MYKIKIINYQPYEYQLFQKTLNELGQQNYLCQDLSLISIFKKVDHPVYYTIDFYKPQGQSHFEKNADRNRYYDYYLERDYHPVYHKRGMYVFAGKKALDTKDRYYSNLQTILPTRQIKTIILTMISLFMICFLSFVMMKTMTIQSLLTYGITFVYIGVFLLLFTFLYRQMVGYSCYHRLTKNIKHTLPKLKHYRLIYVIVSILSFGCIIGGLTEDMLNAKSFTVEEHPIITMHSLGITDISTLDTKVQSSFTVPHYYTSLETTNDETILLTKEYQLHSEAKSKELFQNYINDPQQYLCTHIDVQDHIIYGYYEDTLTTLIFQKEKSVIIVSFSFELSVTQINQIIQFYQS